MDKYGNFDIKGKICLVMGGGGSIGSELARTLAKLGAEKIILVDVYENGVYYVKNEIGKVCTAEIASVRDYDKMQKIMNKYRPNIVFHTAAHKHVPFMENNPEEAVKNNIKGTENTARLAEKYNADAYVLISTDKAVEPISVMGASKRACEMYVYEKSLRSVHTRFFSVRFGNVLNSAGSVVGLFEKQIENGIVTITDKNVTRFFMTIPQAVGLIVKSLEIAEGGEVFVFDMGEPVKIYDLALNMINKKHKNLGENVKFEFIGLRKGDKLHEKLFFDFEQPQKTSFDKILKVQGSTTDNFFEKLDELYKAAYCNDSDEVRRLLFEMTQ